MKSTHRLSLFALLMMMIVLYMPLCSAEEQPYSLSIVDKKYTIMKVTEHPKGDVVYFNISITLKNSGSRVSDNITVQIEDETGIIIKRNGTISPGEIKIYYFNEYPLIGMQQHILKISYYPTIDRIKRTSYNSGQDEFILLPAKDQSSTPGFEGIFFISSLLTIFLYYLYKNKTHK
ncbi:MAG: hypothetical protein QXL17_02115 [Candidatus Thermoplasmatota archaeon]